MASIAILVPYPEMCSLTEQLVPLFPSLHCLSIEHVAVELVSQRAHELEVAGCDIVIARGLYATIVKSISRLPVVEIRITAQELGRLVKDLRSELGLSFPKIALIGSENMMCDTSSFDSLFQVNIRSYPTDGTKDKTRELEAAVLRAYEDGCDAVIGGKTVCQAAEKLGICYRFIPGSRDSLMAALEQAKHVAYAIDLEKSNNAEMETMLDFSMNGIIQIDAKGFVRRANNASYTILSSSSSRLLQHSLEEYFPSLFQEIMDRVLTNGEELFTTVLLPSKKEVVINASPVLVQDVIHGAILTLHEGQQIMAMSSELRYDQYLRGSLARWTFDQLPANDKSFKKTVLSLKKYSLYDSPILLIGESGCGLDVLAECIHNEGKTKDNAFFTLDCHAISTEHLDEVLFGDYLSPDSPCMVSLAQNGSIYLSNIDELDKELQYRLVQLLRGSFVHNGSHRPQRSQLSLIASSSCPLAAKVKSGSFRPDLYYLLSPLQTDIPPLREHPEDILEWIHVESARWKRQYNRSLSLTQGAKEYLTHYSWPGNLSELRSVCEQMFLLSESRTVDEVFLQKHLQKISPEINVQTGQIITYRSREADHIISLLQEHQGNRQKVADALGISTTTLWRRMKKYGIGKDLS